MATVTVRTRVFITIDIEFSIGGTFDSPNLHVPVGPQNVLCDVNGVSEGLGFILATFREHEMQATFFVEALQTAFFGDAPMHELTRQIHAAGHDAQLHLHPVWTYFDDPDWRERLASQIPTDHLHGRSLDELTGWMRRGFDTFQRWGLPAPVALRTGNLSVNRNVYRAMAKVGMKVASNVARAVFEPEEPALRFNAGMRRIEGITELPVLTYVGPKLAGRQQRKTLTIAGSSIDEIRHLLDLAYAQRCPSVVLLTHSHEFVKGNIRGKLNTNRLNQSRLIALCRFLRERTDRFEVMTMAQMAAAPIELEIVADPLLQVPARMAMLRMVQNKLSDHNLI